MITQPSNIILSRQYVNQQCENGKYKDLHISADTSLWLILDSLARGGAHVPGLVVAWTIKRPTSVSVSVSVSAFVRFRKVYLCLTTTECKYKFTFLVELSSAV